MCPWYNISCRLQPTYIPLHLTLAGLQFIPFRLNTMCHAPLKLHLTPLIRT